MDQDPTPTPSNPGHDDTTLAGIEGSLKIAQAQHNNSNMNAYQQFSAHRQSQSLDQGMGVSMPSSQMPPSMSPSQMASSMSSSQMASSMSPSQMASSMSPSHMATSMSPSHMASNISPSQMVSNMSPSYMASNMSPSHMATMTPPLDPPAPAMDTDSPNLRYENTPPLPPPAPTSRPASGLSGRGENPQPQTSASQQPQQGFGVVSQAAQAGSNEQNSGRNHVVIKVGMVGDAQIGKTSLMVKYVEGSWDEDYIQTLGVNFMEKTISIRNTEITFSIWDLGGQREFVNMLPLVCNDAVAILFMFDLTRKSTLNSIKEWYRQGRGFNKTAIPILVGTKYDHFVNFPREDQEEISNQARRFAKAMRAALIFSSTSHSINVQKIFKIVLSKAFDLKCTIPEIENVGEPLLLYQSV